MERWNELIAGFVLGNLTPEEAESIAKVLADNPQLASHIARLRNTATVRSISKTEWSTARSQDGSEGWADTVLDAPELSLATSERFQARLESDRPALPIAPSRDADGREVDKKKRGRGLRQWERQNTYYVSGDRLAKKVKALPAHTFERFSLTEALLVPLFNPLWWTVIALAVAVGIDDFLVRRSLQGAREELSALEAIHPNSVQEQPSIVE